MFGSTTHSSSCLGYGLWPKGESLICVCLVTAAPLLFCTCAGGWTVCKNILEINKFCGCFMRNVSCFLDMQIYRRVPKPGTLTSFYDSTCVYVCVALFVASLSSCLYLTECRDQSLRILGAPCTDSNGCPPGRYDEIV